MSNMKMNKDQDSRLSHIEGRDDTFAANDKKLFHDDHEHQKQLNALKRHIHNLENSADDSSKNEKANAKEIHHNSHQVGVLNSNEKRLFSDEHKHQKDMKNAMYDIAILKKNLMDLKTQSNAHHKSIQENQDHLNDCYKKIKSLEARTEK